MRKSRRRRGPLFHKFLRCRSLCCCHSRYIGNNAKPTTTIMSTLTEYENVFYIKFSRASRARMDLLFIAYAFWKRIYCFWNELRNRLLKLRTLKFSPKIIKLREASATRVNCLQKWRRAFHLGGVSRAIFISVYESKILHRSATLYFEFGESLSNGVTTRFDIRRKEESQICMNENSRFEYTKKKKKIKSRVSLQTFWKSSFSSFFKSVVCESGV